MTAPSLRLRDACPAPARRHALIAAMAARLPGPAHARLPPARPDDDAHARQHVTPDGRPEENGVLWLEREGVSWARRAGDESALSPAGGSSAAVAWTAVWRGARSASVHDAAGALVARAQADGFGRLGLEPGPAWPDGFEVGAAVPPGAAAPATPVAVIGVRDRLADVYGAVFAALGDAADMTGRALAPFVAADVETALAQGARGLVLPGGADLAQVAPLVAAARRARSVGAPTLGLCLGMQAMALAAVRDRPGCADAALAEMDPGSASHLFAAMPAPRLGDRAVAVTSAGLSAALRAQGLATRWPERMNHRFALAERYRGALADAGMEIAAEHPTEAVVDVIADPDHPFFVGAEGHPELTSRRGAPHPLFAAFALSVAAA